MRIPFLAIPVLLALFLHACSSNENKTTTLPEQEERIPVKVGRVEASQGSATVLASGMLSSSGEQRLSFKVGGIIRRILVAEGDQVRPGQLLAELDKTEIDAQVRQAEEGLAKTERDLLRVQGLYRDSSATLELLQNATTARDVAKETVQIARFNQQFAEIRASRVGRVIKKVANEAEITGPGMPVLVIFESGPDDWIVKIHVSDKDWARLSPGMPASIKLDAYENQVFNGKVSDLAVAADPANGLYPIEVKLARPNLRLAPGLFASVSIKTNKSQSGTAVPLEAIVEGDGSQAYVFVLGADSSTVVKTPVQVLGIQGGQALIASGLELGQLVVTAGAPYLTEKKRVEVVTASY